MSDGLTPHPAPHAERIPTTQAFFMLFGGPVAWFAQICIGVTMLSWPCYPTTDRFPVPLPRYDWTRTGAILLSVLCVAIALAAGGMALAKLREVAHEKTGGHGSLIEIGHGRTRFTALWGVILGFGFALAAMLTTIPFLMVSQCAG